MGSPYNPRLCVLRHDDEEGYDMSTVEYSYGSEVWQLHPIVRDHILIALAT